MPEKHGSKLADILSGIFDEENIVFGHGGDDALSGGKLADYLFGGEGVDHLDVQDF